MKFTKMHGAGNDYVYVDGFQEKVPNAAEVAVKVSHRHYGIGSDGLILIQPTEDATAARMEMYNSDGSMSEMCGNGLRCVAKFVYDRGYSAGKTQFDLQTGAGIKGVTVLAGVDGKAEKVTINMGAPILKGLEIPTVYDSEPVLRQKIQVLDREFEITCVSMGNPHCVIFVEDVANFPVEKYGPVLETHPNFPRKINVEFVQVVSPKELIQRTWERGAGETWACGTGASAVCVAGVLNGLSENEVLIHLTGGDLELKWQGGSEPVIMTGGAVEVYQGEIAV
jgi:diaminopimelate epimerase